MKTESTVRVLHLISAFQMGGAEKLLLDLIAENAAQPKVAFTVVIMNDLISEELKDELLATGCEVHLLQRPPKHRHPKYLLKLMGIIRKNRIQIIHSHNFGSKMWAILCKMLFPKLRLVFTIHDTHIVKKLSGFHIFLHKKIINRNIAISNAVLDECTERHINNTTRIYNGIRLEKFYAFRKNNNAINGEIKLVNVARITHRKKGQDVLIRAVHECLHKGLDVSCSFIGGVYEYDKDSMIQLKALAAELQITDKIHFLGNINDVPSHLAQYDVFVLPSRYEGLGLVILEAMAAGLPVIAANIDGPSELIKHGLNGYLFESENDVDLANQILAMSINSSKRMNMVAEASRGVKEFDMAVMLANYRDLYQSLTAK
ncbi:glycosyl transferase family 1 [Paenibacillus baekrokdamisoli]|uniref:Glycosyl transferase family 1 n=1 Tax=Paenibacillus baekrokdamisoli TaxID=1712516 RepID=A0A3G9JAS6_9BACL|nr:glycosyltransferase [Paenibacillus baekrokdamisoli]MBB3067971.1 glycosyltransferase involved in cell wall biosynthesis [Paenibacillus baekrokdamisoli]BBH22981.1 glycosyl transferase family 1 [Paenibacillus baekrokdamisoli]